MEVCVRIFLSSATGGFICCWTFYGRKGPGAHTHIKNFRTIGSTNQQTDTDRHTDAELPHPITQDEFDGVDDCAQEFLTASINLLEVRRYADAKQKLSQGKTLCGGEGALFDKYLGSALMSEGKDLWTAYDLLKHAQLLLGHQFSSNFLFCQIQEQLGMCTGAIAACTRAQELLESARPDQREDFWWQFFVVLYRCNQKTRIPVFINNLLRLGLGEDLLREQSDCPRQTSTALCGDSGKDICASTTACDDPETKLACPFRCCPVICKSDLQVISGFLPTGYSWNKPSCDQHDLFGFCRQLSIELCRKASKRVSRQRRCATRSQSRSVLVLCKFIYLRFITTVYFDAIHSSSFIVDIYICMYISPPPDISFSWLISRFIGSLTMFPISVDECS